CIIPRSRQPPTERVASTQRLAATTRGAWPISNNAPQQIRPDDPTSRNQRVRTHQTRQRDRAGTPNRLGHTKRSAPVVVLPRNNLTETNLNPRIWRRPRRRTAKSQRVPAQKEITHRTLGPDPLGYRRTLRRPGRQTHTATHPAPTVATAPRSGRLTRRHQTTTERQTSNRTTHEDHPYAIQDGKTRTSLRQQPSGQRHRRATQTNPTARTRTALQTSNPARSQ